MRILAVYPADPEPRYFERMPPLGLLWIGGVLRGLGHEVVCVDQQVDPRDPGTVAADLGPALALIGGTSHTRFASFAIASAVKAASPRTQVIYGGPHATFTAEDTLGHVPDIDIIVHGEGEATCVELAAWAGQGASPEGLGTIRGISFRNGAGLARTPPRPPIEDLDSLGLPDRTLVPMERYGMKMEYLGIPGASIMTARGCPVACTFCSASALFGTRYRRRSPEAVAEEIELLASHHGARGIKIFDSTFTLNRTHVEGVCREIERRGIHLPWECEIRVGSVDKALLARMQEAGCYYVDVGIEAGSQRVLDQCIRKRITLEESERLLRWTRELGLLTKVLFTSGHPGETLEEAQETLRFLHRNRHQIRLAGYHAGIKVYPGTEVERHAVERNLLPDGFRWSSPYRNAGQRMLFRPTDDIPILLQPGLGIEELRRLRIAFILDRLRSPRFVLEKIRSVLGSRQLQGYLSIVLAGLLPRFGAGPRNRQETGLRPGLGHVRTAPPGRLAPHALAGLKRIFFS